MLTKTTERTMKNPTSMRLSEMTRQQINELAQATGLNQTEIVSVAIDRMHRSEIKTKTEEKMNMKITGNVVLIHGHEYIGSIVTNQSLSVEDAINLLNVDADQYDDYGAFGLIYLDDDGSPEQRRERLEDGLQPSTWDELVEFYGEMTLSEILANLNGIDPTSPNMKTACELYRALHR